MIQRSTGHVQHEKKFQVVHLKFQVDCLESYLCQLRVHQEIIIHFWEHSSIIENDVESGLGLEGGVVGEWAGLNVAAGQKQPAGKNKETAAHGYRNVPVQVTNIIHTQVITNGLP